MLNGIGNQHYSFRIKVTSAILLLLTIFTFVPQRRANSEEIPLISRPWRTFAEERGLGTAGNVFGYYRLLLRIVDQVTGEESSLEYPLPLESLTNPIHLFRERHFPNGQYRIYLEDLYDHKLRLILDIQIYDGRVTSPAFREGTGDRLPDSNRNGGKTLNRDPQVATEYGLREARGSHRSSQVATDTIATQDGQPADTEGRSIEDHLNSLESRRDGLDDGSNSGARRSTGSLFPSRTRSVPGEHDGTMPERNLRLPETPSTLELRRSLERPATWQAAEEFLEEFGKLELKERYFEWGAAWDKALTRHYQEVGQSERNRLLGFLSFAFDTRLRTAQAEPSQAPRHVRTIYERDLFVWQRIHALFRVGQRGGENDREASARAAVFRSAAALVRCGGQLAKTETPYEYASPYERGIADYFRHQALIASMQSHEALEQVYQETDVIEQNRLLELLASGSQFRAWIATELSDADEFSRSLRARLLKENVDRQMVTWRSIHALYVTGRRGGELDREAAARRRFWMAVALEAKYGESSPRPGLLPTRDRNPAHRRQPPAAAWPTRSEALAAAVLAGEHQLQAVKWLAEDGSRSERVRLQSGIIDASASLTLAHLEQAEHAADAAAEREALEQHAAVLDAAIGFAEELFKEGRSGGEVDRLAELHCRRGLLWTELEKLRRRAE